MPTSAAPLLATASEIIAEEARAYPAAECLVQLREDEFLAEAVAKFLSDGLRAGEPLFAYGERVELPRRTQREVSGSEAA